jgi:hypothetical protein
VGQKHSLDEKCIGNGNDKFIGIFTLNNGHYGSNLDKLAMNFLKYIFGTQIETIKNR